MAEDREREERGTRRMGRVSPAEEGLSYGSYLRVPEVLVLQRLQSDPPAHDELLFIVVHQAYELWFKEVLFELESARDLMFAGDIPVTLHLFQRIHEIERLLVEQVSVLETMSPQDFLAFRTKLSPASGFQSVQFREIEAISGLEVRGASSHLGDTDEERSRLARRLEEPTLWDAFRSLLESGGLEMPEADPEARRRSLLEMARDRERYAGHFAVSEAMLTHDELFALWRLRHVLMVERMIGSKTGTGGSSGAGYLRATLDRRFFPELWELRSDL
jgi:tryptophan 2,3-dioxygenase